MGSWGKSQHFSSADAANGVLWSHVHAQGSQVQSQVDRLRCQGGYFKRVCWGLQWAERLLEGGGNEQWGDKWTEQFKDGKGYKNVSPLFSSPQAAIVVLRVVSFAVSPSIHPYLALCVHCGITRLSPGQGLLSGL